MNEMNELAANTGDTVVHYAPCLRFRNIIIISFKKRLNADIEAKSEWAGLKYFRSSYKYSMF